jgi:hypothetical protein
LGNDSYFVLGFTILIIAGQFAPPPLAFAESNKTVKAPESPQAVAGIGIIGLKFVDSPEHIPQVSVIFPDTAAAEAQLMKRDLILEIDGTQTKGLDKENIYRMLTGTPGSCVKIKIRRGTKTFDKALTRTPLQDIGKNHPAILKDYLMTPHSAEQAGK